MSKKAFLFPGQGSQYVGMAKDLFESSVEAKEMIKTADYNLGANLSHIMFNGPLEELTKTENTQPAIFLHSVILSSIIRIMQPDAVAGHSLGEYSALVCAGAIQFLDALMLVRHRGLAMQDAGDQNPGTMAAIIGMGQDNVEEICSLASSEGIVQCANFNCPGQIVISGSVPAVRKAMELAKSKGARLVKELTVSGAFHSPLMLSAQETLQEKLNETNFYNAKIPVYTNVTAKPVTDANEIKSMLAKQVTSPVLWQQTIENMIADGFDEFYEIGPGKVLQGLGKKINSDAKFFGIEKYSDVEKYI